MPHFERVCSSIVLHTGTELGLCECVHILLGNNLPPVMKPIILIKVLSHLFGHPATVMSGPCEHDSKAVIKWPEKVYLFIKSAFKTNHMVHVVMVIIGQKRSLAWSTKIHIQNQGLALMPSQLIVGQKKPPNCFTKQHPKTLTPSHCNTWPENSPTMSIKLVINNNYLLT